MYTDINLQKGSEESKTKQRVHSKLKMNFKVCTTSSLRYGEITLKRSSKTYKTPLLLRVFPNFSREVLELAGFNVDDLAILVPINEVFKMEEATKKSGFRISRMIGFEDDCLTFMSLKNPVKFYPSPSSHNKECMPIYSSSGKVNINPKYFIELIKTFQPDFFTVLSDDDLYRDSSKKRVTKAKERSFRFLDECLELKKSYNMEFKNIEMGVHLGGGFNESERQDILKQFAAKKFVDSAAIQFSYHRYGTEAITLKEPELSDMFNNSVDVIPLDKLRIMYGAFQPHVILHLVKLGIDVFDDSYVTIVSELQRALVFNFVLNSMEAVEPEIDLTNAKFAEDFSPLSENCSCFSCSKKYSKAYIYHLFNTHEILGRMLIQVHNFHHYHHFFQHIQEAVRNEQLDDMISLMNKQYNEAFLNNLTYVSKPEKPTQRNN